MSVWSMVIEGFARLGDAPIGLVLIAKWTLLLGLTWLAHMALSGRNPRWRVALWRGEMLADIPALRAHVSIHRFEEDRLAALQGRIAAELNLGRPRSSSANSEP